MAKTNKKIPLDMEEEKAERAQFNGMLKDEILLMSQQIASAKTKQAEASGDLSGQLDVFEKKGGHKRAMQQAHSLVGKDPAYIADFIRARTAYEEALGLYDQVDMFEQQAENEKNAAVSNTVTDDNIAQLSAAKPQTQADIMNATH